jgi:hypothetical protein
MLPRESYGSCFFDVSNSMAQFPNLIMKLAGETNASFLDIDSNLGVGFYILIAYSIIAGFLQYSLRIRICDGSKQLSSINHDGVLAEKEKECLKACENRMSHFEG